MEKWFEWLNCCWTNHWCISAIVDNFMPNIILQITNRIINVQWWIPEFIWIKTVDVLVKRNMMKEIETNFFGQFHFHLPFLWELVRTIELEWMPRLGIVLSMYQFHRFLKRRYEFPQWPRHTNIVAIRFSSMFIHAERVDLNWSGHCFRQKMLSFHILIKSNSFQWWRIFIKLDWPLVQRVFSFH